MKIIFTFIFIAFSLCSFTQDRVEKFQRIKIHTGFEGIKTLAAQGFDVDHGEIRPHAWFIGEFSTSDVNKIRNLGFDLEILIPDLKQHFLDNLENNNFEEKQLNNHCPGNSSPDYAVPAGFTAGSMAGFFTYAEMLAHLDNMATLWPNLISVKQPIGSINSVEGNPIYYVKISDNPTVDEPEPKVLYTALHHAREPVSMSQLIFYMYYLLENYQTDPIVQYIVDNTQMYFIPCVNPDGYLYNEFTDPQGGGFWRKNRKDNGDGTFGIDLNRNYGYNWAYNNLGSSPITSSQVYRGTAPFSEPETQAIRDFCITHNFTNALNYHSFGNLLIYPWGYLEDHLTPDSLVFFNLAGHFTRYNDYFAGTGNQTVGYSVNGGSDDWMYGEQIQKSKSFAMTPECGSGSDGFWPAPSRIIPICKENVWTNLNLALLTLPYATIKDVSPDYLPLYNGYINYSLTQLGLDTSGTYTVSLLPVSNNILSSGSANIYSGLSPNQQLIDSISFSLDAATPAGAEIKFILQVDFGPIILADTITKYFGSGITLFAHDCDDMTGWNSLAWAVTNQAFVTAPASITDSPNSTYGPMEYNEIELGSFINLANVTSAKLKFWAQWSIEPDYDYVQVFATTPTLFTWMPLCGKYTKSGTAFQAENEPVYDGFQTWVEEEMDLADFIGEQVKFRFLLVSDNFLEYDGFYFDDLKVVIHSVVTGEMELPLTGTGLYQNYPNPSSGSTTIPYNVFGKINENTSIKILNTLSIEVAQYKLTEKSGEIKINTEHLAPGVYYYFISGQGSVSEVKKMIILNRN
jgi:carboxypeptidase T